MSKENVALFFGALAEKKVISDQIAKTPKTPDAWTAVAKKSGYEFTSDELFTVVKEVLDLSKLKKESTVEAFLAAMAPQGGELSDEQMESVAGGALGTVALSPTLNRRLTTLGYPGGLGNVASYIEMPPMHIQTGSMQGFDKFQF